MGADVVLFQIRLAVELGTNISEFVCDLHLNGRVLHRHVLRDETALDSRE